MTERTFYTLNIFFVCFLLDVNHFRTPLFNGDRLNIKQKKRKKKKNIKKKHPHSFFQGEKGVLENSKLNPLSLYLLPIKFIQNLSFYKNVNLNGISQNISFSCQKQFVCGQENKTQQNIYILKMTGIVT